MDMFRIFSNGISWDFHLEGDLSQIAFRDGLMGLGMGYPKKISKS